MGDIFAGGRGISRKSRGSAIYRAGVYLASLTVSVVYVGVIWSQVSVTWLLMPGIFILPAEYLSFQRMMHIYGGAKNRLIQMDRRNQEHSPSMAMRLYS